MLSGCLTLIVQSVHIEEIGGKKWRITSWAKVLTNVLLQRNVVKYTY
jgi:hypothetical protein